MRGSPQVGPGGNLCSDSPPPGETCALIARPCPQRDKGAACWRYIGKSSAQVRLPGRADCWEAAWHGMRAEHERYARYARRGFGCATPSGAGRLQRVSWVSQRTGGSRSGSATLSRRLGDGSQPRSSKVRKVQWGAHHAVQCRTGLRRTVVTLLHPLWGLIPPPVLGTLPSTPSSSFPA